jgi:dethiobiotin synthetase
VARVVVVVGTDTGVGKTFVTAGLARASVRQGRRVVAVKPVESGWEGAGDGELLAAATGQLAPRSALVRLRAPIAPALAAEREGVVVDVDALARDIEKLAEDADVVFVEGAGGVLSPFSWTSDVTTLAHGLRAGGVVLVGSDRLGTISLVHTAVQVLLDTWLLPEAILLSAPAVPDASTGTNADALRRRLVGYGTGAKPLVEVPRGEGTAVFDAVVTELHL